MAEKILMKEYKQLSRESWLAVKLFNENIFEWEIALIIINRDSLYHGGYLKAKMTFSENYPYSPPTFQFIRPLFHPNIYPDGKLCISILHAPGDDEMSGELASERWSPIQCVESVLLSIVSLLDDAEVNSPANVDAGVLLRKDKSEYKKRVREDVEKSKDDIPEGFVMPEQHFHSTMSVEKHNDDDFWYDSGEDNEFGSSDSDEELLEEDQDVEDQ